MTEDRRMPADTRQARGIDPTPEQIAERCAEIRSVWDAETELSRRGVKPTCWLPPGTRASVADAAYEPPIQDVL